MGKSDVCQRSGEGSGPLRVQAGTDKTMWQFSQSMLREDLQGHQEARLLNQARQRLNCTLTVGCWLFLFTPVKVFSCPFPSPLLSSQQGRTQFSTNTWQLLFAPKPRPGVSTAEATVRRTLLGNQDAGKALHWAENCKVLC